MQKLYVGVDIGTTGVKAVAFYQTGEEAFKAYRTYRLFSPTPEIAEQDVDDIFRKTLTVLDEAKAFCRKNGHTLRLVSFSSAMHSLVAVDQEGEPLTPLITWADKRSGSISKQLHKSRQAQSYYEKTGTPVHPMSPFVKLLWIRDHQPFLLKEAHQFLGIKEYMLYHLFGEFVMDESLASATGLYHIHKRKWDTDILDEIGITVEQLPRLVPTTKTFHKEGVAYVIGASDGVLSNLGTGAILPGEVALSIGTSAAIRSASRAPHLDKKGRTFCYVLTENHWIIGGPINNGGIVLQWLVEELVKDKGIEKTEATLEVMKMAEQAPIGANGLLFLPFLTGERAPLWNPDATASYIGLTRSHNREDMIRAALEGVTFNIYSVLLALQELTGLPHTIYASGGFSRSSLWKQMVADVFDQPLHFASSYESSAFGAVILGMYALGDINTLTHFKSYQSVNETLQPIPAHVHMYRDLISVYLELSRSLTPHFERLSELQGKRQNN